MTELKNGTQRNRSVTIWLSDGERAITEVLVAKWGISAKGGAAQPQRGAHHHQDQMQGLCLQWITGF